MCKESKKYKSSSRIIEEGKIVEIDGGDPLPFLQEIEDLLKTPMRNMVIEEMCGGLEVKCKKNWKSRGVIWRIKRWLVCLPGVMISP